MRSGDRGTAAIELVLGLTLILIPMAMVVLSFAPLLEARTFIRQAAADTARQIASGVTEEARALDALEVVAVNNGVDPARLWISLCGGARSPLMSEAASTCVNGDAVLERGQYVTVEIVVEVDVVPIFVHGITVKTSHRHAELVDLYRSIPQP